MPDVVSPCLKFLLYIWDLGTKLQNHGVGFQVRTARWTWDTREKTHFHIPGLLFADDLVLMARNHNDLAGLLEVTTEYGNRNKLLFNPEKSAVVIYAPHEVGREKTLTIQGRTIPVAKNYKYLGITLSDSRNYLNEQEEAWAMWTNSALHAMHATSPWGFNRFETARVQWKATAISKLTYAYSVLVRSANLRDTLDRARRKAGKWALGIPGSRVSNELVDSELGRSSFEARDAQSKLRYFERKRSMSESRWPKATLRIMKLTKKKAKAYQETVRLRAKYKC
ncbi:uncharacterized protein LOC108864799 [Galendromus occidentalis]|uniref:Uncharacterized protein LOC108864799 n=1 Tax=Galendromus occidentalis TaxID=34638 RepID=A0AAJ7PAK9_9ACAR|nr:uncharacterized protein LOC108864799 [Galendromus occidentalis]